MGPVVRKPHSFSAREKSGVRGSQSVERLRVVGQCCVVMPCCNVMLESDIPSRKRVFVDSRHLHTLPCFHLLWNQKRVAHEAKKGTT